MALYYGKKQISGGRDYKTEHQMEDYSVSFVDDGEGYTDAAAALSEINSGSKFGKLFAAIKGCLMKFLSSISSLSSDLTALQNKATELQNTITELENKATELQEKTTTLENGLTSCNSDLKNRVNKTGDMMTGRLVLKYGSTVHNFSGTPGAAGYVNFVRLTIKSSYANVPIKFEITQRGVVGGEVVILFSNFNGTDPGISTFTRSSGLRDVCAVKVDSGIWDLYIQKTENYDSLSVMNVIFPDYVYPRISLEWKDVHTNSITATKTATAV